LSDATIPNGLRFDSGREWSAATLTGPGKEQNADALSVNLKGALLAFAVADGVGAMPTSPVASAIASKAATDWVTARDSFSVPDAKALYAAVTDAIAAGLPDQQKTGATTLVVAVISSGQVIVASLGDTEVLAIGEEGPARSLLPVDHHPQQTNMLLAWLDGVERFDSHALALDALPYRLCLATDGVAGTLSTDEIADILRASPPSQAAVNLVTRARAAGSHDDATAVVIGSNIEAEAQEDTQKTMRMNAVRTQSRVRDEHRTERKPRS
jgi:serine/threonine protein phosphatase PrpC